MKLKRKTFHVIPNPQGGWTVRKSGAERAIKIFEIKKDAVEYAKKVGRKSAVDLYIHQRDGTISEKDTYATDASPKER